MSYEVHFKGMPAEIMEKYNRKNKGMCGFHFNGEHRLSLEVFIMRKEEKPIDVKDGVFQIKLLLAGIEADVNQREEQFIYDRWKEENGDLWWCGRQYSNDYSNYDRDDVYKYVIERLTLLKYCAETGNYFEDNSHFDDKLSEIKDLLEYFDDVIMELKLFEIMEQLKEYRIPDDYDDLEDDEQPQDNKE